jgi:hypothetical protein
LKDLKYYYALNKSTSLHNFLDSILQDFQDDDSQFKLENGFISFLDETKVNERFSIISAIGTYKNIYSEFAISPKNVDLLSIVFITNVGFFKENIYIDTIKKENQDIFLYFDFKNLLNEEQKRKFIIRINYIKNMILNKNWDKNEKYN